MNGSGSRIDIGALPGRPCSAAAALQVVGEKWALLAVREIFFGNHRFEAIARNTGAPRDRLAARLRSLEHAGVVERRPYSERPPRHEYHLTEAGRDLAPVIRALLDWGDRWVHEEPPVVMVHEPVATTDAESRGEDEDEGAHGHDGHDLDAAWICRTCGEEVVMNTLTVDVRSPGWDRAGPTPAPATP
ncbi:winged helix-turn-helix transcriptional regulator [Streptomyces sp. NPDC057460]|uniref:winged helix-turn-helix transcriptional regulator n=1 Tax=Streptomyces sp. NPDC057460 TaxID=3346141 RepID=UPI0036C7ADDB